MTDNESSKVVSTEETIAVFGGTGNTGREFVKAALARGYRVRALARSAARLEGAVGVPLGSGSGGGGGESRNENNLMIFEGDFGNARAVQETVRGADYAVVMAGMPPHTTSNEMLMTDFAKDRLFPALRSESKIKSVLYQAGAFCNKPDGSNSLMLKLLRPLFTRLSGIGPMVRDNEGVMMFVDEEMKKEGDDDALPFKVVVIRPGKLVEGEGDRSLEASPDSPELSPVTYTELAAFNLEAMKDESLVGKYPFVKVKKG